MLGELVECRTCMTEERLERSKESRGTITRLEKSVERMAQVSTRCLVLGSQPEFSFPELP